MRRESKAPAAEPPRARRRARWRWRDARLWLGLCLIVVSMVGGARVMSSGQETVTVWRAVRHLAPGAVPQVEPVTVALGDAAAAYASAETPLVGRMRVPVAAGALLPVDAAGVVALPSVRELTIAVDPLHAPVEMAVGDVVDVWATPAAAGQPTGAPGLVLPAAIVLQASPDALGVTGQLAVTVEVPTAQVSQVVAALRTGVVDLVEVPATQVRP